MSIARSVRRRLAATTMGAAAVMTLAVAPAAIASPGQTVLPLGDRSPATLADELVPSGSAVSGATIAGSTASVGSFGGMNAVGIGAGVVLSTGLLEPGLDVVTGPNQHYRLSGDVGTPGDDDLDELIGRSTFDAAVLEFEFVPDAGTDTITLQFVFGTDEYPSSANDDVFGFFVNGENYATIADGSDTPHPVSVDAIDPESASGAVITNWFGNEPGELDTEFNLFTSPLLVTAPVRPGEPNHVKVAIADVGDRQGDSAVLIIGGDAPMNAAPVAADLSFSTPFNTPVDVPLRATDADGDDLTFSIASPSPDGTLSGTGPNLVFTPTEGFSGTTTFTYTARDDTLTSLPATVTIAVGAEPPPATAPGAGSAATTAPGATVSPSATEAAASPSSPSPTAQQGDLSNTGSDGALLLFAGAGAALLAASGLILLAQRARLRRRD